MSQREKRNKQQQAGRVMFTWYSRKQLAKKDKRLWDLAVNEDHRIDHQKRYNKVNEWMYTTIYISYNVYEWREVLDGIKTSTWD